MQAIVLNQTGGPEVLQLGNIPDPQPGPGEALIEIEAAGINYIDTYQREGRYPLSLPATLGMEAAGTILALGPNSGPDTAASGLAPGDRVAWCSVPGTYAQRAVAPVDRLIRIPEGVTTQQAAAAMLQGMTAHYLAHDTSPLSPGKTVLVHAGAGGTGLLLIQTAKQLGARVFTTVSTAEKAALAKAAGADETILYTQTDFAAEVHRLTAGQGLDAVYDSVGQVTFEGSLKCLRPRGTLVLFGAASGPVPPFDLIRLSTLGSLYITRPSLGHYTSTRAELEHRGHDVLAAVAAGTLSLRIEHTYALAEAAQAHRDLESRRTAGKLLLLP